MEWTSIEELLQHAELRLLEANLLIARQRKLIDEIRARHESTSEADALLDDLHLVMVKWQRHKDRILDQRSPFAGRAS